MVVHYFFFLQAVNFLRSTKTGIIQLKVSYLTGNRYVDATKCGELWALLGLSLASQFLSNRVCVVCLFLMTRRKLPGETKQIVNVQNYSFVVK